MKVELKVVNPLVKSFPHEGIPQYATEGSAAVDLRACIESPVYIHANHRELIPTGIAINIHDPGVAALLIPRSGLGHKQGLILGNSIGLLDCDYQGEIFVSAWNTNSLNSFLLQPQERIAQLFFISIEQVSFSVVDEFSTVTKRGAGGFGHTGTL